MNYFERWHSEKVFIFVALFPHGYKSYIHILYSLHRVDLPKRLRKKEILILANDFKVREALKSVRQYMVSQSLSFSCPCFVVLICLSVHLENEEGWHVWDGRTDKQGSHWAGAWTVQLSTTKCKRVVLQRCCWLGNKKKGEKKANWFCQLCVNILGSSGSGLSWRFQMLVSAGSMRVTDSIRQPQMQYGSDRMHPSWYYYYLPKIRSLIILNCFLLFICSHETSKLCHTKPTYLHIILFPPCRHC